MNCRAIPNHTLRITARSGFQLEQRLKGKRTPRLSTRPHEALDAT
jgi:hypothetical protein